MDELPSEPLRPDFDHELALEHAMIDQITVIRGHTQLLLFKYPEDIYLTENLNKVLFASSHLTELVRQLAAQKQSSEEP